MAFFNKKKFVNRIWLIVLVFLLTVFISAVYAVANTKSIMVVAETKKGEALELYSESHALLIGVSNYTAGWSSLGSISSELEGVEDVLKSQGFVVEKHLDPTGDKLKDIYEKFIDKFGYNDKNRLLFYYSGHGHTRKSGTKGYLVPIDAPNPYNDEKGFLRKSLAMTQIMSWARQIEAKHVLFLFDSCFSGTVFQAKDLPKRPPHITHATALPVRQFITAGTAGEAVPAQSVFTPAFTDAFKYGWGDLNKDGYISGTELGLYLQSKVPKHTDQTPQFGKIKDYNLARGDFIFILEKTKTQNSDKQKVPRQLEEVKQGTLLIESKPSGGTVLLDGSYKGKTPVEIKGLLLGRKNIVIRMQGCKEWSRSVRIRDNYISKIKAILEFVNTDGAITVSSNPKGAEWYLDSDYVGITPDKISGIKKGGHLIKIKKTGYNDWSKKIEVKSGGQVSINAQLKKKNIIEEKITNSLGMDFVYIKPGTFMMGSPEDEPKRDGNEKQHRVTLTKGFYMQTTEVTQGQWKAVMGNNPSRFKDCGDNCPVEKVSWNDIQEFIRKLDNKDGSNKYSLPTEAQWEYAARAGTRTPFYFGKCLSTDQANYDGNYPMPNCSKGKYRKQTASVTSFSPNKWGLYNMHGNVYEWCQDWYGDYPSGSVTDPEGPSSGSGRVIRGGGWYGVAGGCRSADRDGDEPGFRSSDLGFRLVLGLGQ